MNMKQTWVAALAAGLCLTGGVARATLYNYTFNSGFADGTTVADGNPTGWADSRSVSDIANNAFQSSTIVDVTVRVDLSGGYNGDMYGYLVLTDTSTHTALAFSVLLNHVGSGIGGEPQYSFGYADSVMNVALSDTGANGNIHSYQSVGGYASLINSGGAFQTDGGNLGVFGGSSANNTWTLFLSDTSSGGTMTVNCWGLDINVVPEPVTWAVVIFGLAVAGVEGRRRWRLVGAGADC
jgi:hypothetical protein